uniref:Uncharacterized protein n=1 Tax=Glossina pallidipes TaxID=7398 RepID=A0A1A9ZXF8_GLOPL
MPGGGPLIGGGAPRPIPPDIGAGPPIPRTGPCNPAGTDDIFTGTPLPAARLIPGPVAAPGIGTRGKPSSGGGGPSTVERLGKVLVEFQAGINLIDLQYNQILMRLKQDWGTMLNITFRTDGPPVMVSASNHGYVAFWNLKEETKRNYMNDENEAEDSPSTSSKVNLEVFNNPDAPSARIPSCVSGIIG